MPASRLLAPLLTRFLTSASLRSVRHAWFELKRGLLPSLNTVVYYHRVDDPYCLLMLQALPRLLEDFAVRLEIRFVLNPADQREEVCPLRQRYALIDAARLADFHDLEFPSDPAQPSHKDALIATGVLLKYRHSKDLLQRTIEVTSALWGCSSTTFSSAVKRYGKLPDNETQQLVRQANGYLGNHGSDAGAMLCYGGEWYYGLDRLAHLADRLDKPALRRSRNDIADYQRQYRHTLQSYRRLKARPKKLETVIFYFSFRDPYSYLTSERLFRLTELYKIPVQLKPVPLDMNGGLSVTQQRYHYIVSDVAREAAKCNLPFKGYRPLSRAGADALKALLQGAEAGGRGVQFVAAALRLVWAEGYALERPAQLRRLCEQAGLDWKAMQTWLQQDQWRQDASNNHSALRASGLWDVPSITYGELHLWGHDRLWALEQRILQSN